MKLCKNKINIIFFGSPDFAIPSLNAIVKKKYNISAVVTVEDKKSGRGLRLNSSPIKKFAISNNIKVIQPSNLKDPSFTEKIKLLKPHLQIIVGFRKVPKEIWSIPTKGTINLHASLLPQYRGSAPINWAIMDGEKHTGVTTFFINDKIDKGNIILQESLKIEEKDNASSLHNKLSLIGADLIIKTIELIIEGNLITQKQKEDKNLKVAFKLNRDNRKIDWNDNIKSIHNKIRGLSYYPGAWCFFVNNKKKYGIKIFKSIIKNTSYNYKTTKIGKVEIINNELSVHTRNGIIVLEEVQIESRKKVKSKDLLNGMKIYDDCHLY